MSNCCNCKAGSPPCARNIFIFSSLSDDELYKIIRMTSHKNYSKGEVLCREGEKSSKLFLIREGKIKISKITKDGKEQIVHILSKGDFFGESNLFSDNNISNFTAYAISEVKICILEKESLDLILAQNPGISIKIIKEISKRLSETENLAQSLATKDIEVRIAIMLLEFKDKYGEFNGEHVSIKLPLNREEMANYCGVTRETISRKLSMFDESGIIELKGTKIIIIKDIDRLHELAE